MEDMQQQQDWEAIVWRKAKPRNANDAAQRGYETKTVHRRSDAAAAQAKVAREEIATLKRISPAFAGAMQRARLGRKMTQKQLAAALSVRPKVVNQCESGKALYDPGLEAKIRRVLGIKGKFT